jgi:hypothetical protein
MILTVQDVIRLTNFSQSFVYQHFKELGGQKIGGKLFFHKDSLEEALRGDYKKIQNKERGAMGVRIPAPGREVQPKRIRNQKRSDGGGGKTLKEVDSSWKQLGFEDISS